jgi:hypothetical protein
VKAFLNTYWQCLIPIVVFSIVAAVVAAVQATFEGVLPDLNLTAEYHSDKLRQFGLLISRLGPLALSYFALAVLEVFTLTVSLSIVSKCLAEYSVAQRKKVLLAAILIGILIGLALSPFLIQFRMRSTSDVISFIQRHAAIRIVKPTVWLANVMLFPSAWFSTVAFGVLLAPSRSTDVPAEVFLHRRMQLGRLLLYVLAAFLVTGTFAIGSLYAAPIVWLGENDSEAMSEIASRIAAISGAMGSIFLVCTYVPTQMMLQYRASEMAYAMYKAEDMKNASEWLVAKGLSTGYLGKVPSVLAVLGPMLAGGPLKEALSQLLAQLGA